ncbi:NAD(P)H-hydrate epimerase, partial [Candidatus Peregrinibacteria bacterium]|nr:NAD(P)H-hydrate epimerase [Candidatus Peregrinibacteria bacterium]
STDEMKALERHAVEKYGVSLESMMQKAGKAVFDVVMEEVIKNDRDARVLVVSGKGNNGGDALVTARLLNEAGINTDVFLPYRDDELSVMAKKELDGVGQLEISVHQKFDWPIELSEYSLIIDALFGFSLTGDPYAKEAHIIEQINCSQIPVLSVDVPSGLDAHNGRAGNPTVIANCTVTLGMPKKGLEKNYEVVGKLFIGDIGIPQQAYRDKGYESPLFRGKSALSVN